MLFFMRNVYLCLVIPPPPPLFYFFILQTFTFPWVHFSAIMGLYPLMLLEAGRFGRPKGERDDP
jgi:hypothetical protein